MPVNKKEYKASQSKAKQTNRKFKYRFIKILTPFVWAEMFAKCLYQKNYVIKCSGSMNKKKVKSVSKTNIQ